MQESEEYYYKKNFLLLAKYDKKLLIVSWVLLINNANEKKKNTILHLVTLQHQSYKNSCSFFISQIIVKLKTNKIEVNKTLSYTIHHKLKITLRGEKFFLFALGEKKLSKLL